MQRTTGVISDVGGRARTLLWEPSEINMEQILLLPVGVAVSEVFYVEGFRHFHVYVNRVPAVPLTIAAVVHNPLIQAGSPRVATSALIGTWTGSTALGVFYFGENIILVNADGRSFMFSPIMALRVNNTSEVTSVTIDVSIHAQD